MSPPVYFCIPKHVSAPVSVCVIHVFSYGFVKGGLLCCKRMLLYFSGMHIVKQLTT